MSYPYQCRETYKGEDNGYSTANFYFLIFDNLTELFNLNVHAQHLNKRIWRSIVL